MSPLALFEPPAMSDLSPQCAPKRKSASAYGFMSSRPSLFSGVWKPNREADFLTETNSFVIDVFWNLLRFQYFVLRAAKAAVANAETHDARLTGGVSASACGVLGLRGLIVQCSASSRNRSQR
jgi:hypothetical protein